MRPISTLCGGGLALALTVTLLGGGARADENDAHRYIVAAVRLFESLEYERALEVLAKARPLSRGIQDDVTITLYEGIILAELGRTEQAVAAFREGLLLMPEVRLPVRVSPKLDQQFEQVRSEVKKELAKAVTQAPPPKLPPKDLTVKKLEPSAPPIQGEDYQPSAEVAEAGRSTPVLPFLFAGTAVAAAGVGAYFGLQSREGLGRAEDAAFQDETEAHRSRAQQQAGVANVLFAVAGGAAVGAVISWIASPE